MANMSYCRFENTLSDLEDCFEALQNGEIESTSEKKKAKRMLLRMAEFLLDNDILDEFPEDYEERIKEWIDEQI